MASDEKRSVGVAGTRNHSIDFELDDQVKEEVLQCIAKRGRLAVQLSPAGEVMNGEVLAHAYEQLID